MGPFEESQMCRLPFVRCNYTATDITGHDKTPIFLVQPKQSGSPLSLAVTRSSAAAVTWTVSNLITRRQLCVT